MTHELRPSHPRVGTAATATVLLVAWLAAVTMPLVAPAEAGDLPDAQVLFVCEHGNVKSLMAASYFNRMARARGLRYRAVSRGSAPDSDSVPPAIVAALRDDGFDVSGFRPLAIEKPEIEAAVRLVLINTELPPEMVLGIGIERWTDVPPASRDFEAARRSLMAHVRELIDELERARAPE